MQFISTPNLALLRLFTPCIHPPGDVEAPLYIAMFCAMRITHFVTEVAVVNQEEKRKAKLPA